MLDTTRRLAKQSKQPALAAVWETENNGCQIRPFNKKNLAQFIKWEKNTMTSDKTGPLKRSLLCTVYAQYVALRKTWTREWLEKQVSKWLTDFVGGCVSEQVRIIFSIPI
jgi:hypothetical protein